MTVIFPECAGVELCSQCNSAFRVKDLRYYGKYKHNSSFRQGQTESPSPTHSSYVSRYVNQYPDLQFLRFGHLCINCRAPYVGEGNFEESSLDKQGLSAQGANAGLAEAITDLIYEYYTKREFPEYKLFRDLKNPSNQILSTFLLTVHKDKMSIPGVEHIFIGDKESLAIKLDMRWWRPKQCKCTRLPFCECVCMAAQVRNIVNKINAKLPILRRMGGHYILASIPLQQNLQEYDFLAVLQEPMFQTTLNRQPYEGIYLHKGDINAGYCKTYPHENKKKGSFTNHTSDCGRRVFFRRTRGSPCSADKTTCGRCVDCREKENERRKVVNMVRDILTIGLMYFLLFWMFGIHTSNTHQSKKYIKRSSSRKTNHTT